VRTSCISSGFFRACGHLGAVRFRFLTLSLACCLSLPVASAKMHAACQSTARKLAACFQRDESTDDLRSTSFSSWRMSWNRHNLRIFDAAVLTKILRTENTCVCPSDTSRLPNRECMGHKPHWERRGGRPEVEERRLKSSRIQTCRGSRSRAAVVGAYRRIDVVRIGMCRAVMALVAKRSDSYRIAPESFRGASEQRLDLLLLFRSQLQIFRKAIKFLVDRLRFMDLLNLP
jgi:hypothetical protein